MAEEEGTWRKAYFLRPIAEPAGATHVLVLASGAGDDASGLWEPDTLGVPPEADDEP